ncbi:MAG: TolC family protein [Terricaulis sp.]|nr:TolC family protein [Terricaulis sp.]
MAAEDRLYAAGYRVHAARAALLPRLTLSGSAGATGEALNQIDDSANMITNLIAGLSMPIFQGGALASEVQASAADRRAAASDYVRTTLAAWREVEGHQRRSEP